MRITEEQKPAALAALYTAAHARRMREMDLQVFPGVARLTREGAKAVLATQTGRFDYLNGVCIKMDFTGDVLDFRLYDRNNGGTGTGAHIVRKALGTQTPEDKMAGARSVLLRALRSGDYR